MAVVVVGGTALLATGLPGAGAGASSPPPVEGHGKVYCAVLKGHITFSPSLATGTTSETTAKVSLKGSSCYENANARGDGLNVVSTKISGTVHIPQDGYCFNGANPNDRPGTGPVTITYKVKKGTQRLNPTVLAGAGIEGFYLPNGPYANGRLALDAMVGSGGSFDNQGIIANAYLHLPNVCRKTWAGVPSESTMDTDNN